MPPALAAALILVTATSAGAQEHRHLDAHEHGVSRLRVAVEDRVLMLELDAPGMDIAGFEHAPGSDADRAAVAAALALLTRAEAVVIPAPEAGCRVTEARAEREEDGAHSGFAARYVFDCATPEALNALAFPYFDSFPQAQEIEAEYVTATGAGSAEIPREVARMALE